MIDIRLPEKTEEDADISYPKKLIEFADIQKENPGIAFDPERDKMIVVFDADIFEEKVTNYNEVIALGEQKNIIAITNPGFELFLLLHFDGSFEEDIQPNAEEIIRNEKVKNDKKAQYERRFTSRQSQNRNMEDLVHEKTSLLRL